VQRDPDQRAAPDDAEEQRRSLSFATDQDQRLQVTLDIAEDDDDPHAILTVTDELSGETLRTGRVAPSFKLTAATAQRFLRTGE
jgi:hypothetical protein